MDRYSRFGYWNDRFENQDENTGTIKFKTLFPDFAIFQQKLLSKGLNASLIKQEEYDTWMTMIGNSYLKFRTDVKCLGAMKYAMEKFTKVKDRYAKLYAIDPLKIGEMINSHMTTYFNTDGTEITNALNDVKYATSKVKNEETRNIPYLQSMDKINELVHMADPDSWYLMELARQITEFVIIRKDGIYGTTTL